MTLIEIRQIIEKDNEVKNLVLSDSDLLKVYRYIQIRNEVIDGYQAKLITEPYIEIIYVPTKEKEEEILRNKIKKHLSLFDSDIYLQDASLDSFELSSDDRKKAYTLAREFVDTYSETNFVKGLYIFGKYATGKTYLLSAIAHELAKKKISVLMVFMPDLVRKIKQGISDGDLETRINQLKQADVLMLDDIGGENMTSWFRDEILLPTIQYRLSAKLPVFFSSNLSMEDLMKSLSINKNNELDYVKAVRLVQRIKDITNYVKLSDIQYKKLG